MKQRITVTVDSDSYQAAQEYDVNIPTAEVRP